MISHRLHYSGNSETLPVMRVFALFILMSCVAGCLPVATYYKEGARLERLQSDEIACARDALSGAPVANQVRQAPPRYIPPVRSCNAAGQCTVRGGYWLPGEVYTVDVNAPLRRRIENQCMAKRGYRPVEIPACPPGIAKAAPPGATTVLPTLSARSCAIRLDDGTFRVVTRG
jgi:hypothetical protein